MFHFQVRWFKEKSVEKLWWNKTKIYFFLLFLFLQKNTVWLQLWKNPTTKVVFYFYFLNCGKTKQNFKLCSIFQENKVCPGCCEWDAHCHGRMGGDHWSLMCVRCDKLRQLMIIDHWWFSYVIFDDIWWLVIIVVDYCDMPNIAIFAYHWNLSIGPWSYFSPISKLKPVTISGLLHRVNRGFGTWRR